ncbi:MAG: hypothetical protein ACJ8IK_28735 [Burkholderiaceae bacterium]|jgi:hypothetical protein
MSDPTSNALAKTAATLKAMVGDLGRISENGLAPTNRVDLEELRARAASLSADVTTLGTSLAAMGAHTAAGHGQVAATKGAFAGPMTRATDAQASLTAIDRTQLAAGTVAAIDALQLRATRLAADTLDAQGRFPKL